MPLCVSISAGWPSQNVVRLGFGDLQSGLELGGIDNLGDRSSGRYMLAHPNRHGQGTEDAGDAGPHLQFLLLFLVEVE